MEKPRKKGYRLGVDVGGTFTDLVLMDFEGGISYTKVPSTPWNQAMGVITGIRKILEMNHIRPGEIDQLVHGTTVATNALLERRGSKTALLTTKGFKDVLYIGRQTRSELYSLSPQKPLPLVPRNLIMELSERILYTGEVLHPLREEEVLECLPKLREQRIEGLAVCLLHSYVNPKHEQEVKALIEREYPDLMVCISSQLLREFREYERLNATVINAYVAKIMDRYISSIVKNLNSLGLGAPLNIMQSNGGFMSEEMARQRSVATLLSGPAAGALGAAFLGRLCQYDQIISADMGGTSFDLSLIVGGEPTMVTESRIDGFSLKMPVIDIHTIGAGGGSIAWVDPGGILQVGPKSAGADPGPVCYGKGGTEPTVTDANVLLGRINPGFFLGGGIQLDVEAARRAIQTKIAEPLGMSLEPACEGILTVVNAGMVRGIRVVSVEKGYDVREFTLLAFGGAGPLHGCDLARNLKMPRVLIPVAPGNFSTFGLLTGDVKHDDVRTYVATEERMNYLLLNQVYEEMEREAFRRMRADGFSDGDILLVRTIDLRYFGQAYELRIPLASGEIRNQEFIESRERFHRAHQQAYGFSRPDERVEAVNLRVTSIGKIPSIRIQEGGMEGEDPEKALKEVRRVFLQGRWEESRIFSRERLQPGNRIEGPAVIEEVGSTTLIFPGDVGYVDAYSNIRIEIQSEGVGDARD
jgi:N-methylhydantoinase A